MNEEGIGRLLASNRSFRTLWAAQLISLGGDWFNSVALLGLTLDLTGSPSMTAFLIIANTLPLFLLAPLTGTFADRFDRRKIMVLASVLQAGIALGFQLVHKPSQLWMVYALTLALVTCEAFFLPACGAALPNLVTAQQLGAANALSGASWGAMLAVGAALGGLVAGRWGRDVAFQINAVSFLLTAVLVASVRGRFQQPQEKHSARSGVGAGFRYLAGDRAVLGTVLLKTFWGVGNGIVLLLSILPVMVLKTGDEGIGLLYACRGVGTFLGPVLAHYLVRSGYVSMRFLGGFCVALSGIFACLIACSQTLPQAELATLVCFLGGGAVWALSSTLLQSQVPNDLLGRLSSLDLAGLTLTMSLSVLFCGWGVESALGPQTTGCLLGAALTVLGVMWLACFAKN